MQSVDHDDTTGTERPYGADSGATRREEAHPANEVIHQSAAYAFSDSEQAEDWFASRLPLYARDRLPNVRTLERAVADLEAAEDAIAVSSGMAAIATTLLALLRTGERVLISDDAYCESSALLLMVGEHFDLAIDRVDLNDPVAVEAALSTETRLILAETISNPGMRLLDLPMLATIAKRHGIVLAVDNTFATPVFCQPIAFGADLVIHSAGKFLAGHSDATAGVVAGSASVIGQLKRAAHLYGPVLAPMEAWLTSRGMRTLVPRLTWASATALQVAEWLSNQPEVEHVAYPGLANPDQAALARRILSKGSGAILTFRMRGGHDVAAAVVRHLQEIPYVPSVGGVSTIISFPPKVHGSTRAGRDDVHTPQSATLRLSVGLENVEDIVGDLGRAFARATADSVAFAAGEVR